MPRVYRRKLGARHYANYSKEQLELCLAAIRSGTMTQRKASEEFKIPRRTIAYKLKNLHMNPPGQPQIFTDEEEESIASHIEIMGNYGFPLTEFDLKMVVKTYLEKCGRTVRKFKNNVPGNDWIKQFLKRHPRLSVRFATNIKKSRAALSKEILQEYIDNLRPEIQDIPPTHIFNYDETNLTDDPGQKRVIVRRGSKYPEKICNVSKTSTSIMFCGSAYGELLPPYVVYKSQKLWDTWTENGPNRCHYSNSPSGWFDHQLFSDWLEKVVIPRLKKMDGKKMLIGDNLASHLSVDTLKLCRENNIAFVCLPANSTHITQPLDVAFFRPLKSHWRKILTEWKESSEGTRNPTIPKQIFPSLLKKLIDNIKPTMADNLKNGFRKCGIYPCNIDELLARIPGADNVDHSIVSASFVDHLELKRKIITESGPKRRKKRFEIAAGKSISHELFEDTENQEPGGSQEADEIPSCSRAQSIRDTDLYSLHDDSDDSNNFLEPESCTENDSNTIETGNRFKDVKREKGSFVVVRYDEKLYPGLLVDFDDTGATVDAMAKSLKSWKWPEKKDINFYEWENVLGGIDPPKLISKRGFFTVKELCDIQ
jgi:hypothetical protein